ncbi:MAG: hypothetical protein K1X39_12445 [Thermoflexales bacterium]|nr:hypothetical protein [Thermoflexales bacterium]
MNPGFIASQIKRVNRNYLITALILLLLGGALLAVSARELFNVLAGPAAIDRASLLNLTKPGDLWRYNVTFTADKNVDSGVTQVTTTSRGGVTTGSRTSAYYRALLIEDKIIVAKMPDQNASTIVRGALVAIPKDVQTEIIDDAIASTPTLKGRFLPYMLDAVDFGKSAVILGIGILVLLGAGLFMAFQFARRAFAGENHPILTALAKYGQPQFVRTAIDATIPEGAKTRGAGFLASNVMLFPSTYGMATFGVSDLVWAYRLNTRRNGVTTITLQMADKDGKQRATPALSDATATSMLKTLAETAPWMVVGYSAELEKSWKTNKQAFIQAVQDRRAAMQSQPNR